MYINDSYGMEASLRGSIQSISETAELYRFRAELAEKRLRHIRRLADSYSRKYMPIPVWRVLDILDGAADLELEKA